MASLKKTESKDQSWLRLQKKIFSRWISQKLLLSRGIEFKDVITDFATGHNLVALLEVLSDTKYSGKLEKVCKMRVQQIDNCNRALDFCYKDIGLVQKLKISGEDVVNGDERRLLGFIWLVMLKFMRFGDDESDLNAKDALLMWINNKVADKGITVNDFTKSMRDGRVLLAIIHKHRPKLVDWEKVGTDPAVNLPMLFEAAEKYFGLEQYLSVADFAELDEKCMVIYCSEYFYGIAEQRKLDLAARRIDRLGKFTKVNDAMRAEYKSKSAGLKEHMDKVGVLLGDRTIDNTMAGAKQRLEQFYEYKTNDKGQIIGDQLNLQSLYNHLAMRLTHGKRPPFQPGAGLTLQDIDAAMVILEQHEAERKVALHAELNRQIKLLQLDEQHKSRSAKLDTWLAEKKAYLETKEVVESVGAAQYQLGVIGAYEHERIAVADGTFAAAKKLGEELVREKYERSEAVQAREATITSGFATLDELAKAKRPVLEDHLAREEFRAKVELWDGQHVKKHSTIEAWVAEKRAYLDTKEVIESVSEAQLQLSLLAACRREMETTKATSVANLKTLGKEILDAKYETQYSSYVFPQPEAIQGREGGVDSAFAELEDKAAEKKRVLDDDLAREEFKALVRQMVQQHVNAFEKLEAWVAESTSYLNVREEINSVPDARLHVALLEAYEKDKITMTETAVSGLKALGAEILGMKYETKYSQYEWERPAEITGRHDSIDGSWANLSQLSAAKKDVLDAALAKEIKKEELRLQFARLAGEFLRWTKESAENTTFDHFGFDLPECEAYAAVLDASDAAINAGGDERQNAYNAVHTEMTGLGVTENIYTNTTLDDLAAARSSLGEAVSARRAAYDKELARQQYNDALCKKFAEQAEPLAKWIIDQKNDISTSTVDLDAQLANVTARIASKDADGAALATIKDLQGQIDAAEISNNRHTLLTYKDMQAQWDQFVVFLERKKEMLNEQIAQERLRGVTPEEYAEIESNFKSFDKAGAGVIDARTLKALLYSLGEEMPKSEIAAKIEEFGEGGQMPYEGYKNLMVALVGSADTAPETKKGFQLIARNADAQTISMERMEVVMEQDSINYFTETAPKVGDDYDFASWTDDCYSR